jgi:hypothetical protein
MTGKEKKYRQQIVVHSSNPSLLLSCLILSLLSKRASKEEFEQASHKVNLGEEQQGLRGSTRRVA